MSLASVNKRGGGGVRGSLPMIMLVVPGTVAEAEELVKPECLVEAMSKFLCQWVDESSAGSKPEAADGHVFGGPRGEMGVSKAEK
eukprot:3843587-Rhodomonas_salina.1